MNKFNMNKIKMKNLTPEQITLELKKRAKSLKIKIKKIQELKRISPETIQMFITI